MSASLGDVDVAEDADQDGHGTPVLLAEDMPDLEVAALAACRPPAKTHVPCVFSSLRDSGPHPLHERSWLKSTSRR
jgi:hypothetical protein